MQCLVKFNSWWREWVKTSSDTAVAENFALLTECTQYNCVRHCSLWSSSLQIVEMSLQMLFLSSFFQQVWICYMHFIFKRSHRLKSQGITSWEWKGQKPLPITGPCRLYHILLKPVDDNKLGLWIIMFVDDEYNSVPWLSYIVEQRLFIVQLYFKCESPGKCHRKIRCQFPGQPLPSKQTWSVSWKQQDHCYTKSLTRNELCYKKRNLIDWLIDWLTLGSGPYGPDAPRPYRRALCAP